MPSLEPLPHLNPKAPLMGSMGELPQRVQHLQGCEKGGPISESQCDEMWECYKQRDRVCKDLEELLVQDSWGNLGFMSCLYRTECDWGVELGMAGGGGVPRFLWCLEAWRVVNRGGTQSELEFLKFSPN